MEARKVETINMNKMDETEIIKRILKGEKQLYELLVRRNNQKIYRVIRTYLKEEAEVEDVMQNSYLKAYFKLDQFKMASSFSTWLIRIAINESYARLKEMKKGQRTIQIDVMNDTSTLKVADIKQLNPQEKMIRKEAKTLLENAIDELEPKYRTVYVLKEVEEMSLKEIAIAMDLTVSNVKVRIHRSKEMLREKLLEIVNEKNIFEFGFGRCDRITERVMNNI